MIRIYIVLWLAIALALASRAQTKPLPPEVEVELAVKGPQGQMVANAQLVGRVFNSCMLCDRMPDIVAVTDNNGVARFKTPAGVYRMAVKVRGVGQGSIGTMEFVPGTIARPQMPRLAAYASIEGTFPTEACQGDVTIHAFAGEEVLAMPPISPGRFRVADVPGGGSFVWASVGNERCADSTEAAKERFPSSNYLWLEPGRTLRNIRLTPPTPVPTPLGTGPPANGAPHKRVSLGTSPEQPKKQAVWVRGTVRDETGKPVANASVMALATYQGAIRMYQVTSQAFTNAAGDYELLGQGGLPYFSATVVATAPGHPPTWAWPAFPLITERGTAQSPHPPIQDLVLPSKSGSLRVTVTRLGQPAPGITVAIYLENANLRDVWAMPLGGTGNAIVDAAYPAGKTDAAGLVTFDHLLPGRYRVVAAANESAARSSLYGHPALGGLTAESLGIPVRTGQTTTFKMNIYEQRSAARFRVLRADGSPLRTTAAIAFGPVDTVQWNSSVSLDSSGRSERDVDHAGLWHVRVMYRDSPIQSFPIAEPYFLAAGHIAVSPNLSPGDVAELTARRVEPASARVVVQDVNGNPLHVTVEMSDGFGNANERFLGSTDDRGEVLFHGLTTGMKYYVSLSSTPQTDVYQQDGGKFRVRPAGAPPPVKEPVFPNTLDAPLPGPDELRAEPAVMEQTFVAEPNTETKVLMRAEPLRYIYGTIHGSSSISGPYDMFQLDYPYLRRGALMYGRAGTGQFVAGPFPPGDVRLNFGTAKQKFHAVIKVDAAASTPIRLDIDADRYEPDPDVNPGSPMGQPDRTSLGMGGIYSHSGGAERLKGKVVLADGITPALGAQVLYFQARQTTPSLLAMADALGHLQPRGLWRGAAQSARAPDGPSTPLVVAFLPGTAGAVTQVPTPNAPLNLVLPPPTTASGRVTVGGVSPSHMPGVIRVLAEYQGRGFLNSYLTVSATADADGNFTLAGLTPGTYLIQAALDDIWLSSTVRLIVGRGRPKRVKLNIPLPSAPVRLELRDASGNPVAAASVRLERNGPLAVLWPREWISDAAGSIYVPTIEAGRQAIVAAGQTFRFKVPPLPSDAMALQITIKNNQKSETVNTADATSR